MAQSALRCVAVRLNWKWIARHFCRVSVAHLELSLHACRYCRYSVLLLLLVHSTISATDLLPCCPSDPPSPPPFRLSSGFR